MNQKRVAAIAAVVTGCVLLAGCVNEDVNPLDKKVVRSMTWTEQQDWVAEQLDAAVAASGVSEGWFDTHWHDVFWAEDRPEDRALLYSAWTPRDCPGGGARLSMAIKNMTADDPLGAAARVRAAWEAQGYEIGDYFGRPSTTEPNYFTRFEDGAVVEIQARAMGMSISVHTSCSGAYGASEWIASVTPGGNPFKDELERREAEGE